MADLVRIGTVAQRTGATRYNLLDKTTAGNIFLLDDGIKPERRDGDLIIMQYRLKSHAGTNAQIQAAEEKIQDQLINAEKYATDPHRSAPVFLWFNVDGITERKRCIIKGSLEPVAYAGTNELLVHDTMFYDLFLWVYPPWEGVTETTEVSAVTLDGVTNHVEMTSIKGDIPGRISEFVIRGTATNNETSPLYRAWIGIRPEYISMDGYDPIWDLEYAGSYTTDVTIGNFTSANCYPSGSTGTNALKCTFAVGTGDLTRASISLNDVWKKRAELVTNGGAESGNTTGWTIKEAGWAATTTDAKTGTYSFESIISTFAATDHLYQDINVTAGLTYRWEFEKKLADFTTVGNALAYIGVQWLNSTTGSISLITGIYQGTGSTPDGDYVNKNGYAIAPTGAVKARINLYLSNDPDTGAETSILRIDDVSFKQVYSDDYDGDYLALLRCKLDSGEVDVYAKFGYSGTTTRAKIGKTQAVTNTDWKLIPLGVVSIPPERRLTDEQSVWRINKLTFDINAQVISGTPTLDMDAIILIPWEHGFYADGISVCRSSYEIGNSEYAYADLEIYRTELDEMVVFSEAETFDGVDTNIRYSSHNWTIPEEDSILVAFCQRSASHEIADDFVVTLKYYPRYIRRTSD